MPNFLHLSMHQVNVNSNFIENWGSLARNFFSSISYVSLAGNQLKAINLAKLAKKMPKLRFLDLADNVITNLNNLSLDEDVDHENDDKTFTETHEKESFLGIDPPTTDSPTKIFLQLKDNPINCSIPMPWRWNGSDNITNDAIDSYCYGYDISYISGVDLYHLVAVGQFRIVLDDLFRMKCNEPSWLQGNSAMCERDYEIYEYENDDDDSGSPKMVLSWANSLAYTLASLYF